MHAITGWSVGPGIVPTALTTSATLLRVDWSLRTLRTFLQMPITLKELAPLLG